MNKDLLTIKVFNDPIYAQNGMILSLKGETSCWIFDPGLPPQAEEMLSHMAELHLQPAAIIISHAHGDHMAGIDALLAVHCDIPVYLAREEWHMLSDPQENLSGRFGLGVTATAETTKDLTAGMTLSLGSTTWEVLDTSGHSPGGRTIYSAQLGIALVGDAIFAGSIGRVDFHHSNEEQLLRNLHDNILTLPDETVLVPGHGPHTTVGAERKNNPYLR